MDANAQDERDRKPREASQNGDEKAVGELLDEGSTCQYKVRAQFYTAKLSRTFRTRHGGRTAFRERS